MRTAGPVDLLYFRSAALLNSNIISVKKEYITLKEQHLQCLSLLPFLLPMRYSTLIVNRDISGEVREGPKLQIKHRNTTINRVYSKPSTPPIASLRNVEERLTTAVAIKFESSPSTSTNAFFSISRNDRIEQNIFVKMYNKGLDTSKGLESHFAVPEHEKRGRIGMVKRETTQADQLNDDGSGRAMQRSAPAIRYAIEPVLPLTGIINKQSRRRKKESKEYEGTLRGNLIHHSVGGINEADTINLTQKPAHGEENGKVAFEKSTFSSGNMVSSEGNVKVEVLADRVYELLERKIRIEKERRGM